MWRFPLANGLTALWRDVCEVGSPEAAAGAGFSFFLFGAILGGVAPSWELPGTADSSTFSLSVSASSSLSSLCPSPSSSIAEKMMSARAGRSERRACTIFGCLTSGAASCQAKGSASSCCCGTAASRLVDCASLRAAAASRSRRFFSFEASRSRSLWKSICSERLCLKNRSKDSRSAGVKVPIGLGFRLRGSNFPLNISSASSLDAGSPVRAFKSTPGSSRLRWGNAWQILAILPC
mmetsp:Transcript_76408/g.181740  ORF Transcript_76408/g.181740 Transcript_76408/m.181740 type:complete len:236 (-) Transcript_76408:1329-2036(-)